MPLTFVLDLAGGLTCIEKLAYVKKLAIKLLLTQI